MFNHELGVNISKAFLGYIYIDDEERSSIIEIDENAKDDDKIYLTCTMHPFDVSKLMGHPYKIKNELFEFFPGSDNLKSGDKFWCDLMALNNGLDVYLVNDGEDNRIYLFHVFMGILYHLGRVHEGHRLESLCHWRYKRLKM